MANLLLMIRIIIMSHTCTFSDWCNSVIVDKLCKSTITHIVPGHSCVHSTCQCNSPWALNSLMNQITPSPVLDVYTSSTGEGNGLVHKTIGHYALGKYIHT